MGYVWVIVRMVIISRIIHVSNVYTNVKLVKMELIVLSVEVQIETFRIALVKKDIMMMYFMMIVKNVLVMNVLLMITVSSAKITYKFQNALVIEYSMMIGA